MKKLVFSTYSRIGDQVYLLEDFFVNNEIAYKKTRQFTWDDQPFTSFLKQGVESDVQIYLDGEAVGVGAVGEQPEVTEAPTPETPEETANVATDTEAPKSE